MFLSQNLVIAANIFSMVGLSFFLLSSLMKKRKNVALSQSGCHILNFIAWILLGTYSGAVQEGVSLARNTCIILKKQNKVLDILFIVVALALGIIFNVDGWLGILPVLANCQYTIILLKTKNIKWIKTSMIFSCICWIIYSFVTLNYASAIFNIATVISTIITLIIHIRKGSSDEVIDEKNNEIDEVNQN